MAHTSEWKMRLHLFEEERTTKAHVVLDTGTTTLTGHGIAHRNPADSDVPEIGDELAAGRALNDLGRQLVALAEHDVEGTAATGAEREPRQSLGWAM
ncbi:dsRBD fold-containing protein [Streptomyces sp. NPDC059690]|uniref:dsRBD fold-containing protein n=1 Tax=unclassified Streptomyces TaxID=2593676 RepID=UPI00333315FA